MSKKKEEKKEEKKISLEDQLRLELASEKIAKVKLELLAIRQQTDTFRTNQVLLGLKMELNQYKMKDANESLARIELEKSNLEQRLVKELDVKSGKISYDEEGNIV